jgi:putative oxidoreductase
MRFWEMEEGPQRMQNRIHFFKNLSMIGSALYIAATADCDRRRWTDHHPSFAKDLRSAAHAIVRVLTPRLRLRGRLGEVHHE